MRPRQENRRTRLIIGLLCGVWMGAPACGGDNGETCDDGLANSDDVPDACRLDCTKVLSAASGGGARDTWEFDGQSCGSCPGDCC